MFSPTGRELMAPETGKYLGLSRAGKETEGQLDVNSSGWGGGQLKWLRVVPLLDLNPDWRLPFKYLGPGHSNGTLTRPARLAELSQDIVAARIESLKP